MHRGVSVVRVLVLIAAAQAAASTQELARGAIVDRVSCVGDSTQTYALYLPTSYVADRASPILIGFHPAARGRAIVETYRDAAETYGYIVAASNNSRNGPWEASLASIKAMLDDLGKRFHVAVNRVYMTGLSGGARVALRVGLTTKGVVAGVIASSAGFPDSRPRNSLPFVLFGTAGTEDFNYLELRQLDRALTTPHRLAVFDGGHTLPPATVALAAIEWLELQAMKSGLRARDAALIDRLYAKRESAIAAAGASVAAATRLRDLVDDFTGLRDVSAAAARVSDLAKQKEIRSALQRDRAEDEAEARDLDEVFALENDLRDGGRRPEALDRLREVLVRWSQQAAAVDDSPQRRRARRSLRAIAVGSGERVQDEEYLQLIARYRQVR